MKRCGALVLLAVAGCSHRTLVFLRSADGARSAIVAIVGPSGATESLAIDIEEPSSALAGLRLVQGSVITVVQLPYDLVELGVPLGPLATDQGTRALPCDRVALEQAVVGESAVSPWTTIDALPAPLSKTPLPPLDLLGCVSRGRCPDVAPCGVSSPAICAASCSPLPIAESDVKGADPLSLEPCPPGWFVATRPPGVAVCEPFALTDTTTCSTGQARLLSTGCTRLGREACPSSGWSPRAPMSSVFVMPGATGGDGSRARPFGLVMDAMRSASNATIALALGVYPEDVDLLGSNTLLGACPEGTTLSRVRVASASKGVIEELSVVNATTAIEIAGTARLVRAFVRGGGASAIAVDGGRLDASLLSISGAPLSASAGGVVRLDHARIDRGSGLEGIFAASSSITASDLWVAAGARATSPAITATTASAIALFDSAISGGASSGLHAARSRVDIDMLMCASVGGAGIAIEGGGPHHLRRAYVLDSGDTDLDVRASASVEQADALVLTRTGTKTVSYFGLQVSSGARLVGRGLASARHEGAVRIDGSSGNVQTSASLQDLRASDGVAVTLYGSATMHIQRIEIHEAYASLDLAALPPADPTVIEDLRFQDPQATTDIRGYGVINLTKYSEVRIARALVVPLDRDVIRVADSARASIDGLIAHGRAPGTAIVFESISKTGSTSIGRFDLSGFATTVNVESQTTISDLHDGVISSSTCAFALGRDGTVSSIERVIVEKSGVLCR
jgi:hypothetical protein